MRRIRIHDHRHDAATIIVDLRDILLALGPRALRSRWTVAPVTGPHAPKIEGTAVLEALVGLAESGTEIEGSELLAIARGDGQAIWAELRAHLPGEIAPWLILRAIDSSWFEVETDDDATHRALADRFRDLRPGSPPSA